MPAVWTLDIFSQDPDTSVISLQLKRAKKFVESKLRPQEADSFKNRVSFILLAPTQIKNLSFKFKKPFNSPQEFTEFYSWIKHVFPNNPDLRITDIHKREINESNCMSFSHIFIEWLEFTDDTLTVFKKYFEVYSDDQWNFYFLQ